MNTNRIYSDLNEIFRDVFGDDRLTVSPTTKAADIPEWDSFNHINIIVAAESRFGVKFSTAEVESLKNVGEMVALIARKQGSGEMASA